MPKVIIDHPYRPYEIDARFVSDDGRFCAVKLVPGQYYRVLLTSIGISLADVQGVKATQYFIEDLQDKAETDRQFAMAADLIRRKEFVDHIRMVETSERVQYMIDIIKRMTRSPEFVPEKETRKCKYKSKIRYLR